MRVPWLVSAVAGATLLVAYLVFALLLGSTVLGLEVRLRHCYLSIAVAGLVIAGFLAHARRRGRLTDAALQRLLLASASVLVALVAVDTVLDTRDLRRTAALVAEGAFDETIGNLRVRAPMYYPTAGNFTIHKPEFQSAGSVYGDMDLSEFRRSPTLMRSVLERRRVVTSIDAHGFRETVALDDAPILALGDSLVSGPTITQELTWPKILESLIARPVYSLGTDGSSPAQQMWLLAHVLSTMRPRAARHVLWMIFEGNDLEDDYAPVADVTPRLFDQSLVGALTAGIPRIVRDRSVLGRVRSAGFRPRRSAGEWTVDGVALPGPLWRSDRLGYALVCAPYLEQAAMPASYVLGHPNRPALEGAFAEMKRLAAAHGLGVVVVLAPSFPRLYAGAFGHADAVSREPHFLSFVARLAAGEGFAVVNLAELLRSPAERELLYFRDDTHWNGRGNRVVAELIARHALGR